MISKHQIVAGLCFALAIVGIGRTLYWCLFLATFLLGFLIHLILHKSTWSQSNPIYNRLRTSFLKSTLVTHIVDIDFESPSNSNHDSHIHERAQLTGIPDLDEPLYDLIDLFVREYIEEWYRTRISSDESFIRDVKNGIYTSIRHLAARLREIDWLDFCTGTLVDSFATHVRLYRKAKERHRTEQAASIESCFFDFEAEYERGICRDEVCSDRQKEKDFLRDIVEALIYILLPANEFRCVPIRVLLREVAVNIGVLPFIEMYSDSDAINQLVIKMCQQIPLTIENFLLVVRTTDSKEELTTLIDRLDVEINRWRSKDTGGENDADIRAILNSYQFLKKLLHDRLDIQVRLEPTDEDDLSSKVPYRDLPLIDLLNNCNGLDLFLKFLQTMDAVGYGNFYVNVEQFRCAAISAHQQHATMTREQQQTSLEILRKMAKDLIEQCFLATGTFKLPIDETLVQNTLKRSQIDAIDETLLDELQSTVFDILSSDKYYGQFKTTSQYLRVLSEIEFTDSLTDNFDTASLSSNNSNEIFTDSMESKSSSGVSASSRPAVISDPLDHIENYAITTEIIQSGVCCEKGEKYAIYVISVSCKPLNAVNDDSPLEWITYRRFNEFNDLHLTIRKRYPELQHAIHLPNKNFINSTSQDVRSKRQKELNEYLMTITTPQMLQNYPQLAVLLMKFLRNQQWKHEQTELTRKMDTIVNPLKQASMGIAKGVSKLGGGLTIVSESLMESTAKIFRSTIDPHNRLRMNLNKDTQTFSIVEETQAENVKNIPLRVLLVIMDEVFDLKQKNMWFRSRFVSMLKGFLRAFMGDSVNRRITLFVQHWTSATKIAKEITRFKNECWPNGSLADKPSERDVSVRHVTQVLCKAKLLGIVSDELRHIIGSETTRRGLLLLFELLQNETLNRRFVYIVLESLLIKLFQPNDMKLIFEKLYSRSARVKDEYRRRTMKRDYSISSISTDSPSLGGSSARGDLQQRFFAKNPSKSFQ